MRAADTGGSPGRDYGGAGLIERDREVEVLDTAFSTAAAGRGSVVLIEGAAGLGKTALMAAARERSSSREVAPLRARGNELETAFAFGVARQLLEPPLEALREQGRLPDGPARAAVDLIGAGRGQMEGQADELALVHSLYRLVADLADGGALALLVDDLHWCDRSSLGFLVYLAQRVTDLPVVLVAAYRPHEPDAPEDLLARLETSSETRVLQLDPLTSEATTELVRRWCPDAERAFCDACARASAGNPLLAVELLRELEREALAPDSQAAPRAGELVPDSLLRSTLVRLERLPRGARELAEAVAIAGDGVPLRRAAALAGIAIQAAANLADTLAAVRILEVGTTLQFEHPLLRSAVYARIPAATRAEGHRRAAHAAADDGEPVERVAAQLLEATCAADPWAVEQLRTAARVALQRAAADSARRYLQRALREPSRALDRGGLLLELAHAEALLGDAAAAGTMEDAVRELDEPEARAEALYRFGWILFNSSRLAEAVAAFEAGLREVRDSGSPLAAPMTTALGALRVLVSPTVEAPPDAVEPSDEAGRRALLSGHALARIFRGERCDEARELAVRSLHGEVPAWSEGATVSFSICASCAIWSDAFDEADEAIERALEVSRECGAYADVALGLFGRSWVGYWSGRLSRAAADAGAAIDAWRGGWGGQIPHARYWQAMALVELDRLDEAAAVLNDPAADSEATHEVYSAVLELGRARLALATGDVEEARAAAALVAERTRGIAYLHNPAVIPWRSYLAEIAVRADTLEEAATLAGEDLSIARRFGSRRATGIALRASAIVAGRERGVELMEEAVAVLEESPARLELIRAQVDLGAALRRAGRRADARQPLRAALDRADDLGAAMLRRRAAEELAAAGARPRRARSTGVHALTPSERRVAELAAEGKSNSEIARELFVGRRTVEFHLSSVYRKLGVQSRADLPGALDGA